MDRRLSLQFCQYESCTWVNSLHTQPPNINIFFEKTDWLAIRVPMVCTSSFFDSYMTESWLPVKFIPLGHDVVHISCQGRLSSVHMKICGHTWKTQCKCWCGVQGHGTMSSYLSKWHSLITDRYISYAGYWWRDFLMVNEWHDSTWNLFSIHWNSSRGENLFQIRLSYGRCIKSLHPLHLIWP